MPFALFTIGLILIITGFQNTYKQFGSQLQGDFTGQNNFLYWVIALVVVGSIGYVDQFKTASRTFIALVIIAMIISNSKNGLFNRFTEAIQQGTSTTTPNVVTSPATQ